MQFLVENSLYVTLIIATMILIGILTYVGRLDGRLRRLERGMEFDSSSKS